MTASQLREEVEIELDCLRELVLEVSALRHDVAGREPTVREKTAAGAFLAQFYGGVENILKRIHYFYALQLPAGDTWHLDLFKRYCQPGYESLPILFDQQLAAKLAPFRKFRHVVYHGYGFQIDWDRMITGLESIDSLFDELESALKSFLASVK